MAIRMTFYSVVLTTFMCVATVSQQPVSTKASESSVKLKSFLLSFQESLKRNKEPLGHNIGVLQQKIVKLEQVLAKTDDKSSQQLRNEISDYYYHIGKMFSEMTDEQCLDLLADGTVLLLFRDPSHPAKDVITENAIFALQASLGYTEHSDAKRLMAELEARRVSNDATPSMPDLKAMNVHEEGDEPIDKVIGGYQSSIVKIEQLLETPGAQNMKYELAPTLADLYHRVGKLFSEATVEECTKLVEQGKEGKVVLIIDENAPAEDVVLENAIMAVRLSLHYKPGAADVERLLSKLKEKQGADKASPKMVQILFDSEAEEFDEKLAALKYEAPEKVASEVGRVAMQRGRPFASALDAGCGTGLVGPLIRQYINGLLVGADIAPNMLNQARLRRDEKGLPIYDELIAGDLLSLDFPAKPFELVVSADVLVYFGDFGPILSRFKSLLAPGGVLIFTCERLETSPTEWKQTQSSRFSHGRQYVEETALSAGLRLVDYREIVPRYEGGKEVPGHIFVFENGQE